MQNNIILKIQIVTNRFRTVSLSKVILFCKYLRYFHKKVTWKVILDLLWSQSSICFVDVKMRTGKSLVTKPSYKTGLQNLVTSTCCNVILRVSSSDFFDLYINFRIVYIYISLLYNSRSLRLSVCLSAIFCVFP